MLSRVASGRPWLISGNLLVSHSPAQSNEFVGLGR
jgi:hypothetical protein